MVPPHGLLEIKCPMKTLAECTYLTRNENSYSLKKNHNYFHQITMQLAVTGLEWCYFFVWREDESHLEVIYFDENVWRDMKYKLDMFYFNYYLN